MYISSIGIKVKQQNSVDIITTQILRIEELFSFLVESIAVNIVKGNYEINMIFSLQGRKYYLSRRNCCLGWILA